MPYKLSGLLLNRVDLVPDGSNPDAHIMLFKSKEGRVPKPAKKKATSKAKADTRSKSKQRGDEDEEEEEDDDLVTKSQDDEDEDEEAEDDEDEVDDEDDEDVSTKKAKSKGKGKAAKKTPKSKTKKARQAEDGEDVDDQDDEDDETDDAIVKSSDDDDEDEADEGDDADGNDEDGIPEDVMKSLPKHVRKALAQQSSELRTLRKESREASRIAKEERERRVRLEFVEKAKQTIPTLPGTDQEKGAVLKAIADIPDEDVRKSLRRMLKSGDTAMKSLFAETGRSTRSSDDDDSPLSQLREIASDLAKADTKLTKEQAFEKACQKHPDLFQKYRVEKRRQSVVS